jgi:hypothetical protein
MDAREAAEWLQARLKEKQLVEAENKLQGKLIRAPMSELERRKLIVLAQVSFGSNSEARGFVHDMLRMGHAAMITRNQAEYIETLWNRYRLQHWYKPAPPYTEIMRVNEGLYVEPYACDPANDEFTITFQDNDLW